MKKLSGITVSLLIAGLIFFSCEEYNMNRGESIRVGDLKNMDYTLLYKTIKTNNQLNDSFFIDLDRDGIDDFKLYMLSRKSDTSDLRKFLVSCLHEGAFIGGFLSEDSVYIHTRYDTIEYTPLQFDTYKNTVCSKTHPDDTFMNVITTSYVHLYKKEDTITCNGQWINNEILLNGFCWKFGSATYGSLFWKYYIDCFQLPINTTMYIGLKLKYSNVEKLGWMKLESNSSKYDIYTIIDYAIQK